MRLTCRNVPSNSILGTVPALRIVFRFLFAGRIPGEAVHADDCVVQRFPSGDYDCSRPALARGFLNTYGNLSYPYRVGENA